MKLPQDSDGAQATRKMLKPQVERRRRERMNRSLESLRTLLLQPQGDTQRRVEKAEILEHAVVFLQKNSAEGEARRARDAGHKHPFHDGFSSCLRRAAAFLGPEVRGLRLRAALHAAFAPRLARPGSEESARLQGRPEGRACSPAALRNSSRSLLRMLIHRSKRRAHTPAAAAASSSSSSSCASTAPRQTLKASRLSSPNQNQNRSVSQNLWRPWP